MFSFILHTENIGFWSNGPEKSINHSYFKFVKNYLWMEITQDINKFPRLHSEDTSLKMTSS